MKEILTLNRKEQNRLIIMHQIDSHQISPTQAAALIQVSERQVWRLLAAYRREGAAGLAHGNRERRPVNALPEGLSNKVIELASTKYLGFNHSHLTEKLQEREQLHLSRSSVRSILLEKGLHSPRTRRAPQHRSRRERYPREGMLLQTDGSDHAWLEGRGPRLCLIGAIDDATSTVPSALFREQETTEGYMRMLQGIVLKQGIPMALYHDRHGIFDLSEDKLPSLEEQLAGKEPLTQMGRLLKELGIESISAHSPQAKGRVERLWGTFQDRLTSELRLAGAKTLAEANQVLDAFLPDYNRRFGVAALAPQTAYRKVDQSFKPEAYFVFKHGRTVGQDNVVRYEGQRLQILPSQDRLSYALCRVVVHLNLDGNLAVYYQDQPLETRLAPPEATLLRRSQLAAVSPSHDRDKPDRARVPNKPSLNHPWRGKFKVHFD